MISLAAALLAAVTASAQQIPAPPNAVLKADDCKRLNHTLDHLYEAQRQSDLIESSILGKMGSNTALALADIVKLRAGLRENEGECSERVSGSLNFDPQLQQLSQAIAAANRVCVASGAGRNALPAHELDGSCSKAFGRVYDLDFALRDPAQNYKSAELSCSPPGAGVGSLLAPIRRPCGRPGYCDARTRKAAADRLSKAWKDEISKFKAAELVQVRSSIYPLIHYAEGIYRRNDPAGLEREHFNAGANIAATRQLVMTAMDVGRCK